MSDPKRKSPATRGGIDRARFQKQRDHSTRLPPYAKTLNPDRRTLWVLAGTESWEWAKNSAWMHGAKVVLPPGDHPSAYGWRFAQSFVDCVIVAAGHPPPFDIIAALAAGLLAYLDLVIYLDPEGLAMRLNPARRAA